MDHAVAPACAPVRGAFEVPGSKTYHQRALLLAALAEGPCRIVAAGGSSGEDVRRLAEALERLGRWSSDGLGTSRERMVLDLGRGATGFRFAVAAATLRPAGARTLLRGHSTLLARPHGPLLRVLTRLGAHVKRRHSGAVRVVAGGVRGGEVSLNASVSSQYASALLLIAPRIGGVRIHLRGHPVSTPYLRATLEVLRSFGIQGAAEGLEGTAAFLSAPAGSPRAESYRVPPDASAAAAWWAAAALTGGRAWVEGLSRTSAQADVALLGILERMGARVAEADGTARVEGPPAGLRAPGRVDLSDSPDLLPLVAVLAARAKGETYVTGVSHARRKETDRVATVARGLADLGAAVAVEGDDLRIRGGGLRGGTVDVRQDHRLAFAFGVLGLVVPGVVLRGAESGVKSHPDFLRDLGRVGGGGPRDG